MKLCQAKNKQNQHLFFTFYAPLANIGPTLIQNPGEAAPAPPVQSIDMH